MLPGGQLCMCLATLRACGLVRDLHSVVGICVPNFFVERIYARSR